MISQMTGLSTEPGSVAKPLWGALVRLQGHRNPGLQTKAKMQISVEIEGKPPEQRVGRQVE